MSASNPSGRAAVENELLARLGLPPSASPEDIDKAHLAVGQFLAAAPPSLRAWARVQSAALDEAYLQLTDPVGLEGSALRSPTRPPTVVPGGPATPPARRDPVPAAPAPAPVAPAPAPAQTAAAVLDAEIGDDTDTDDLDALFASVTPGAHRDMVSGGKPDRVPAAAAAAPAARVPNAPARPAKVVTAKRQAARPAPIPTAPAARGRDPWKIVAVIASLALAVAVFWFGVIPFVGGLGSSSAAVNSSPAASTAAGPDPVQVTALMQKITANPNDTASLQQLGDLYYGAQDFSDAGTFYDKVLSIDANNVKALLARGAVYYNLSDGKNAKASWDKVVALDPKNVEAHYDLGFLALNQTPPDWTTVQSEWRLVIQLDPNSDVATNVQKHLDALVAASMIPAPSGSAGASGAPAASGSAAPSGAPSASGSPAPSGAAASGSPAASPAASAAPASPAASGSAKP